MSIPSRIAVDTPFWEYALQSARPCSRISFMTIPPFAVFADDQFLFPGLRVGDDLLHKPDIKLHMIQSFFQQDGPHLHEHFRADRLLVCPIFCFSQHLKGVHVRLPELVIQKALDAEALHSQGVQEILIPYSVLEPEQILISAQQSYRADKG